MTPGAHDGVSSTKYLRTAELMDEALLELLGEKDLPFITVKEICQRAGVSRSTFYLHYEGIADLLAESFHLLVGRLVARFDDSPIGSDLMRRLRACPDGELHLMVPAYLTPYLEFVRDNQKLFLAVVSHPEAFELDKAFSDLEEYVFQPILDRLRVPQPDRAYLMTFYLSGLMAIITRWIRRDCADPIPYVAELIGRCCEG